VVNGRVGLDTFEPATVNDPRIRGLLPRITMAVDPTLRKDAQTLTQSRVTIKLGGGKELTAYADGARGYPSRPLSEEETADKFRACAGLVLDSSKIDKLIPMIRSLETLKETAMLTSLLGAQQG